MPRAGLLGELPSAVAKQKQPIRLTNWFGAEQGLVAGIHRQFIFTGLRLGLYSTVRILQPSCLVNSLCCMGPSGHAPQSS